MRCGNCQHLNPERAVACLRCGSFLGAPAAPNPLEPSAAAASAFAPGDVLIDRYVVEQQLGEGGMSAVYQVRDLRLERRAALKVLGAALLQNWKAKERMKREANALARIHHPHVVRVHNVLEIGGTLAIELELVSGGTLASRIAQRRYDSVEAKAVMEQVLDGLCAIHDAGLVHRDLKPGNVLLTAEGTPKIADLGIARDPDAELLTAPGSLLGTPDYMSPEQVRAVEVGPASDVYSCGIVLYEMLSRRLPFDAQTEKQALAAHLSQAPNLDALPPDVPHPLRSVIAQALEKQPERRFANARAMLEALRGVAFGPVERARVDPSQPGSPSEPRRIGEYIIHRLVGEGGMGRVYAAEERLSRRPVALKVMRAEVAASAEGRRLFLNEMAVLARLDHPNVVRSLACAEVDGQLVMVLELLQGETLRERLTHRGHARWDGAVDIAIQIARALDCAHSLPQPIVHRDLKPENVMILPDGTVKVMDFGIAKVLQAVGRTATLSIGTLQYMSPEQIDAKPVDGRSDLYSLGLVLYEMLAGRVPFESPSQRELLNMQCMAPPPPLPEHARGLPRGVEQLLLQLLEKSPQKRPPSAREVLARLEPFASADPAHRASLAYDESAAPLAPPPDLSPRALPSGNDRAGSVARQPINVPSALAVALVVLLSLLAGGATLLARVATNVLFANDVAGSR